jgi:hypothetical protein
VESRQEQEEEEEVQHIQMGRVGCGLGSLPGPCSLCWGVCCSGFFPSMLGCLGDGGFCLRAPVRQRGLWWARARPRQAKGKKLLMPSASVCHTHRARAGKVDRSMRMAHHPMAPSGVGRFAYLAGAGCIPSPETPLPLALAGLLSHPPWPWPHFFPVVQTGRLQYCRVWACLVKAAARPVAYSGDVGCFGAVETGLTGCG